MTIRERWYAFHHARRATARSQRLLFATALNAGMDGEFMRGIADRIVNPPVVMDPVLAPYLIARPMFFCRTRVNLMTVRISI